MRVDAALSRCWEIKKKVAQRQSPAYLLQSVIGPEDPAAPSDGRRTTADRPQWWAVLAVSLALMALVATVSSTRRHGTAGSLAVHTSSVRHPATRAGTRAAEVGAAPDLAPPSTDSTGTTPTTALRITPAVAGRTDVGTGTDTDAAPPSAPVATTTSTTAPAAAPVTVTDDPVTTTTAVAATAATSPDSPDVATYPGDFDAPDPVSATYPVGATSGTVRASVTFSGTTTLDLSISCSGGDQSQAVVSGGSLTEPVGGGNCSVTLTEPAGVTGSVPYTLTVETSS
jgi:hypothetical protein